MSWRLSRPLLGGRQVVDDTDGVGKEHGVAFLAGGVAQGGGQVGFAQADSAQEHHVGVLGQELQAEEVLELEAVDFLGPVPPELFKGFEDREAGGLDPPFNGALAALVYWPSMRRAQVFDVVPVVLGGLLGQFPVMVLHEGQFQIFQVLLEQGGLVFMGWGWV